MIQIIPAIDIIDGKCVRLSQGDYNQKKVYNEDPLEVAKEFEGYGITRLHMVDLDGARSKHVVNHKVLERVATHTSLTVDFGGGIKTDEDLDIAFDNGASLVTLGSIAVKEPERMWGWCDKYGAEKIILGADVKDKMIAVNGWLETSKQDLFNFLDTHIKKGINNVLCTDISKDGMLAGPSIELYSEVMRFCPTLNLIASGGVSCLDDIKRLNEAGIPSVVFGKAIYEGKIDMNELTKWVNA
ncbi:MAG: 1-(5-phosphoribosyl)-5-[Bacteroidaceae bacterium]|jgi:phosphoribosylformimino-5-aminoimidazole carboxamide ribotide isomerase|nr:1-(5-phosphoribosyl)-5-[(5-phosphoribosylamino)methylideneamino]imidazole-4-carboxamide isomerase [Bacteroidaceae bacterium]